MLRQIGAELGAHWSTLIDQFHRAPLSSGFHAGNPELRDRGLTWTEVAEQVGLTVSGVWSRYRRARPPKPPRLGRWQQVERCCLSTNDSHAATLSTVTLIKSSELTGWSFPASLVASNTSIEAALGAEIRRTGHVVDRYRANNPGQQSHSGIPTNTSEQRCRVPLRVPIRTGRVRRAGLVLACTRSIYGWFGGVASVLAGRVPVREVRERSIGFRWRRPQPVKGAVDRGSSDAEQLGEFGLGVGAFPMIGRRQDVKKRRTSAGASSVCCAN